MARSFVNRRSFLLGLSAGVSGAILVACGGQSAAPAATSAPSVAATTAPSAAPTTAAAAPTSAPTQAAAATTGSSTAPTTAPAPQAETPSAKTAALPKGTTLSAMYASWYVPECETILKNQLADWGKQNGVTVTYTSHSTNDLQAALTAAITAGSGPDLVETWWFWPHLYADHLVDVSDVSDEIAKAQGAFYPTFPDSCEVDGHWRAVPQSINPAVPHYRLDYFKEIGASKPADTWDDVHKLGTLLKQKGWPVGVPMGHSNDPVTVAYPLMWSYGAQEVDDNGKVIFDNEAMRNVLDWFTTFWKDACDPTGTSWDDSSNNRFFLAGKIGWTINGTSIYFAAKKDAPDVAKQTGLTSVVAGPNGRYMVAPSQHHAIPTYSKYPDAVKSIIRYLMQEDNYRKWFEPQVSFSDGPTPLWEKDPAWDKIDPVLRVVRDQAKYNRLPGWPAKPSAKSALVMSKFIVTDTFAKAVTTGDSKAALTWGADQLRAIYEK